MSTVRRTAAVILGALVASVALPAFAFAAAPPRPMSLDGEWQIRDELATPAPPQPVPPEESQEGQGGTTTRKPLIPPRVRASQLDQSWRPVHVPSVFDADARPELYGGTVKTYRLQFRAPATRR